VAVSGPSSSAGTSPLEQELHLYKVCMQRRRSCLYGCHGQCAPRKTIGPVQWPYNA